MTDDIENPVISKLSKLYFALQIDETADISGVAHVLEFVIFIYENKIVNKFLYCNQPHDMTECF